jgi:hypothetical protein
MNEVDRQQLDRIMNTARRTYAALTALVAEIAADKTHGDAAAAAELQSRFEVELEVLRSAYVNVKTFQATHLDNDTVRAAISEIDGYFSALGAHKPAL